jgi:hypothetical protein
MAGTTISAGHADYIHSSPFPHSDSACISCRHSNHPAKEINTYLAIPAIVIASIEHSDAKFDTSTEGLIELSKAKVPQPVIAAMIKRGLSGAVPAASAEASVGSDAMKPSQVVMITGVDRQVMKYVNPQTRTAARALGFGGVASYAVLRGNAATLRTSNTAPVFLVAVPNQAQADSYFTLASFAVRGNNSREVMIGGGYMSYSTGIHPDRVIALKATKAADQARAPKDFSIYELTPAAALPKGEYAVILYTGEMQGLVGAWFAGTANSYFDFGVE